MRVVVTGWSSSACERLLGLVSLAGEAVGVDAAELLKTPASYKQDRVVWFYSPPWALAGPAAGTDEPPDAGGLLKQWLALHRTLLRKRRALGQRLVLVNAEHANPAELLEYLGIAKAGGAVSSIQGLPNDSCDAGACLSSVFELDFPEHCDVFEALEALAWHGPAFTARVPDKMLEHSSKTALQAFQLMLDGQAVSGLKATLTELHERLATLESQLEVRQADSELLELQLSQLREELDLALESRQRDTAAEAVRAAERDVELGRVHAELQQQKEALNAALSEAAQATANEKVTGAECVQLKQELSRLQELVRLPEEKLAAHHEELARVRSAQKQIAGELEARGEELVQCRAANEQLASELKAREAALAEASKKLVQLADEVRVRDKGLADVRAELDRLTSELKRHEAENSVSSQERERLQAELAEARTDNEMLLLQLHQVQEDLERYFLENRQLQQVVSESHTSMERARKVISRLVAVRDSQATAPAPVSQTPSTQTA